MADQDSDADLEQRSRIVLDGMEKIEKVLGSVAGPLKVVIGLRYAATVAIINGVPGDDFATAAAHVHADTFSDLKEFIRVEREPSTQQ